MTSDVAACLQTCLQPRRPAPSHLICLQPHRPAPSHLIDQTAFKNYSFFSSQIARLGLQSKVHCSLQHGTEIQSLFHWCYWPVWDWRPGAATMGFSGAATTLGTEVFICNRRTKLRVLAGEPLTVMNIKTSLFIGKTYFRMWTTPVASHPPWRSDSGLFLLKCIYAQQTSIFYHSLH